MDWLLSPVTVTDKLLSMLAAIVLFAVIMGGIVLAVDRERIPKWVLVLGFLGPVMAVVTFGLIYPTIRTIIRSFQVNQQVRDEAGKLVREASGRVATENTFSFGNYGKVFGDDTLFQSIINSFLWTVLVPVFATAIGLLYAVIIDRSRFEKFAKALIFIPMAISMVGASIIWRFIYDVKTEPGANQVGLTNQVLVWLGLSPVNFFSTGLGATLSMIVVMIWIQSGFAMTVLSAAIKGVPDDVIEAARIDGATGPRLFFSVTIPSIRPTLVVVLTTLAIGALKAFDIVQTMAGADQRAGVIATAFIRQQTNLATQGVAAALAVVLFILVMPIIVYNVRQMRLSQEQR